MSEDQLNAYESYKAKMIDHLSQNYGGRGEELGIIEPDRAPRMGTWDAIGNSDAKGALTNALRQKDAA